MVQAGGDAGPFEKWNEIWTARLWWFDKPRSRRGGAGPSAWRWRRERNARGPGRQGHGRRAQDLKVKTGARPGRFWCGPGADTNSASSGKVDKSCARGRVRAERAHTEPPPAAGSRSSRPSGAGEGQAPDRRGRFPAGARAVSRESSRRDRLGRNATPRRQTRVGGPLNPRKVVVLSEP
jgi:hypothetical protein